MGAQKRQGLSSRPRQPFRSHSFGDCVIQETVSPHQSIVRVFDENAWLHTWCPQVLGLKVLAPWFTQVRMYGSSQLAAVGPNGVGKQFRCMGMHTPLTAVEIAAVTVMIPDGSVQMERRVCDNVHESPGSAPSKGAKLCTYHFHSVAKASFSLSHIIISPWSFSSWGSCAV